MRRKTSGMSMLALAVGVLSGDGADEGNEMGDLFVGVGFDSKADPEGLLDIEPTVFDAFPAFFRGHGCLVLLGPDGAQVSLPLAGEVALALGEFSHGEVEAVGGILRLHLGFSEGRHDLFEAPNLAIVWPGVCRSALVSSLPSMAILSLAQIPAPWAGRGDVRPPGFRGSSRKSNEWPQMNADERG